MSGAAADIEAGFENASAGCTVQLSQAQFPAVAPNDVRALQATLGGSGPATDYSAEMWAQVVGHPETKQKVTLTVHWGAPPQIVDHPADQTVPAGSNVTFRVLAVSNVPLGYQWQWNETYSIPGANDAEFTISQVQTNHAGRFRVIVTNVFGAVTSSVANLTVTLTNAPTSPIIGVASGAGNEVVLSWGTNWAGYVLEYCTNLSGTPSWWQASPSPVVVGESYTVTNVITGPRKFYRIRHP